MPTAADASNHHESDTEDDLDYVPEGEERDSDTDEERDTKRPRVDSPPAPEDLAAVKSERQALWAKFQDSANAPASAPPLVQSEPKRLIKIEKRHRFAGEDVVEIVEVPEDSPDAKKWPLWKPPEGKDEAATPTNDSGTPKPSTSDSAPVPPLPPTLSSSSASLATTTTTTTTSPPPTTKQHQPQPRPGRRKPKQQLAELPSAVSRKGLKRLTTLEKSALDWKAHVGTSGDREPELASELEANRRGGGYLEKVEFLQRVDDRKNQTLEANLDHKRRRG